MKSAMGSGFRRRGNWRRPAAAAVGLALALPAGATVDWTLDASAGYDTNPGRVSADPKGSATVYAGGTLTVDEHRPRLDVTAGANLGYLDYLELGYGGQVIGSLSTDIRYALIPKTLYWNLDERFGQGTENVLAPASPSNRTNVNIFSTGPSLVLPLNTRTRLVADARFGLDTYGSGSLPNDDRYSASLGFVRQLSPRSTLSLNGDYLKVHYASYDSNTTVGSNPVLPLPTQVADYDRTSAYLRYQAAGRRTDWTFDAGVSRVNQQGQGFTSPVVRATVRHKVSAFWSVDLAASREFSDGAQSFAGQILRSGIPLPNQPPPGIVYTTQNLPLNNQPLRTDLVRAGATWQTPRTTVTLGAHYATDRFLLEQGSDDDRTGADVGFTRRLSPHTDLHLGASFEERQFPGIGASDRTAYASATYSWQFDPSFQCYTGYNFEKRDSTSGYNYTDNRITIGIRYTPWHRQSSGSTPPRAVSGTGSVGAPPPR